MTNIEPSANSEPPIASAEPMPFFQTSQTSEALVWPPPLADGIGAPIATTIPIAILYRGIGKSKLSDFREGVLQVSSAGINVEGKMMPRQEISQPIIIFAFFLLRGIGALIAWAILRYGFARPASQLVGWSDVTQIVLDAKRRQAGFAFNGVNYKGKPMEFCLSGRLTPVDFAAFADEANRYAPSVTTEGRLKRQTTLLSWIVLGIIIVGIIALIVFSSLKH